jgi:uncharacterized protein YkwD
MFRPLLILTLLLTLGPAQAMACRQPDDAARMTDTTLAAINAKREQRGMAALTPDPRLTEAALAHACDSAARNRMSHEGSDGSDLGDRVKREGYRYRAIAENVAAGYRTPTSVVEGWMGSSGHRRNILTRNARDVGLGIATARDGTLHWVLNLGTDR